MHSLLSKNELENSWLEIGDTSLIEIDHNPMLEPVEDLIYKDNPGLFETSVLRRPEYLSYFCYVVLGITLAPYQMVLIDQLWKHSFPLLVGSRGSGKCQDGNSFVISDYGFQRIKEFFKENVALNIPIHDNISLLGEKGYHTTDHIWKTKKDAIKVKTNYGYEIIGSVDHPIRVVDEFGFKWKKLSELSLDDRVVIDRNKNNSWPDKYSFDDPELGYLFGLLVGDGGYTVRGRVSMTTNDPELIELINPIANRVWGKQWKKLKKPYVYDLYSTKVWDELFTKYGFNSSVCAEKDVPKCILQGSKDSVSAFIRGYFDADGTVEKNVISCCSKSKELINTIQFLLTRFGIISRIREKFNKKYNKYYYNLVISGQENIRLFNDQIGFSLRRKQNKINQLLNKQSNTNNDTLPHNLVLDKLLKLREIFYQNNTFGKRGYNYSRQLISKHRLKKYEVSYITLNKILDIFSNCNKCIVSKEYKFLLNILNNYYFYDKVKLIEDVGEKTLYDCYFDEKDHSYISNGLISHNTFIMAVHSLLRCMLLRDHKVIVTAPSFRQSKRIVEEVNKIWNAAPMLRSICKRSDGLKQGMDKWTFTLNDSSIIAIPIGPEGRTIRGMRANTVIADEFKDHDPQIIEEVIFGFGAVSISPIEKLQEASRKKALKETGVDLQELEDNTLVRNQSIICGTASYYFEIFYDYWKRYKAIIEYKGDADKLRNMGISFDADALSYKDFTVMRLPYSLLPDGYFDAKTVARAKTSMSKALYLKEYEAVFVEDSDGFFKRSLIETCCATEKNIEAGIIPIEYCNSYFDCSNIGTDGLQYIMGIDPAYKEDNFAICVLECYEKHARIKYVWITNQKDFEERKKYGVTSEDNYYAFCSRHIRELMKEFNIIGIALDMQGGGESLAQTLADPIYCESGEKPIYQIVESNKPKDTDNMVGEHIIYPIQFANYNWVSRANHGLLADMEKKRLLFPRFDAITIELSIAQDKVRAAKIAKEYGISSSKVRLYDSLEDVASNIEELKDELTSIQYSKTSSGNIGGREKWSVPEVRVDEQTKISGKKDRYCALLMANDLYNIWRLEKLKDTGEYIPGSLVQGGKVKAEYESGYGEQSGYHESFHLFGLAKK